jgi:hypothetical protein
MYDEDPGDYVDTPRDKWSEFYLASRLYSNPVMQQFELGRARAKEIRSKKRHRPLLLSFFCIHLLAERRAKYYHFLFRQLA